MSTKALLERVDREAHAQLMPILLDRAALHHRKGWGDCDCAWCRLKQRATSDIANSPLNLYGAKSAASACASTTVR
jgi:hypothetical protein